jgi:hypothetical protein
LKSRLPTCKAGALLLEPHFLFLLWSFLEMGGLANYLPGAGLTLWFSWSLPPKWLGLQLWATSADEYCIPSYGPKNIS